MILSVIFAVLITGAKVRTMLEAIISFFPSEGNGAIGALDWKPEERKKLAQEVRKFCC